MDADLNRVDALKTYDLGVRALDAVRAGTEVSKVAKIVGLGQLVIESAMAVVVRFPTTTLFLEAYDNHTPPMGLDRSWDTFVLTVSGPENMISVAEAAANLRTAFRTWDLSVAFLTPDVAERLKALASMRAWLRQRLPENTGVLTDKDFMRVGTCCWCGSDYNEHELVNIGSGLIAAQCKDCREASVPVTQVRYDIVARRYADYALESEAAYLRSIGL